MCLKENTKSISGMGRGVFLYSGNHGMCSCPEPCGPERRQHASADLQAMSQILSKTSLEDMALSSPHWVPVTLPACVSISLSLVSSLTCRSVL